MKNTSLKINFRYAIVFLSFLSQFALAAEMPPIAQSCTGCHGQKGISPSPLWPNLAGQKEDYLLKQLKAFKDETRKDPMMNPLAQNLTETDMKALALFFSQM